MAELLRLSGDGFEVWVNYLTSNLRITSVEWILPDRQDVTVTVTCNIFDTNISETEPIFTRVQTSPSSGTENVAGQYRAVWVDDEDEPGGGYYDLPPNIVYTFGMEFVR